MAASSAPKSDFDVESFIHEYYDAWGGTDEDRIMDYYSDDVVFHIPGTAMAGKEALRDQFVRPFITAFPGNRHLVKNMIFGPGLVAVEFSFEAQHKGPFAGHVATGARVALPGCGVYEYDAAKRQITGGHVYFDTGTLMQIITDSLVDDRETAEEALRSYERNVSLMPNDIPTLIHVLSSDGSALYVNQAVLAYTGLTLEDVRKEDYRARVFHPEDVERLLEKRREALARAVPFENEQRLLGRDGTYRWFLFRYNPLLDEQGRNDRWYVAAFDIEDRKRAEAQLAQAIDSTPALIHTALPDGNIDFFNQQWLNYVGLPLKDLEGWKWTAAIHPADVDGIVNRWREALASGEPFVHEARVQRADGEYRWMLHHKSALRDERGGIVKWYGSSIDIEERRRAEALVEQAYLGLAQAQRLSKTGSFVTDLVLDEHNWSEELCRIFELNPGTRVTTEAIRALFHPEDLPVYEDAFKRAVDGRDRDIDITYRIITPAGNVKHLHAVAHVLEKIAGRPVYIGAIQDVTDSKVAEEALTRARAELAHMARVTTLSALTASIAHEINQPIAAAITSADACLRWLSRDQPEVQRAREAVMRIEEDGRRAAEIIAHMKSFYKKDVSPQREIVSVNDVVGEMLVLLRTEADRHAVAMRAEPAADLPPVSADRVQLQQVLMNLMLNGMEAMREGGGELKISTRREGRGVMVSASDTGVGIPADKMEDIFNPFFTTKTGGTGMGLAISRTIVESHGGRLWATVNPGRGAAFHFTLPAEPEAHQ
jgi:PAS domain S-box-containing protein